MRLAGRRIGIVGAGVGGLAAAIALQQRGAIVRVFERVRRPRQGIALLVWSNAMRALRTLGVSDALLALASPIEHTRVCRRDGELLAELPIGEWSRRAEMPTVTVRRGDLLATLAAQVEDDAVCEGAELAGLAQEGEIVRVRFADGRDELVDALIGADGLSSAVRAELHGHEAPRELDQQAWVGWASTPHGAAEPGIATATIGRGPRFWYAPLAGGTFWYATTRRTGTPERRHLLEAFDGWHAPIAELIAGTRDDDLVATPIRDRPPLDRWGLGAVTLLGDAAHPSTPDLGQGACQAIESAVVLAASLDRADSIEAGLRAYEETRRDRTAAISRLCWMTSVNSTLESAALCRLRDGAIRIGLRAVARTHLEWILAGQAW